MDRFALRGRRSAIAALLAATLVLALAQPAAATTPTDAKLVIERTVFGAISGTYNGPYVQQVSAVVDPATGQRTFHARITCTCTVAGVGNGTLVLLIVGTGIGPTSEGSYRILSGTDGLAGAHGNGTFVSGPVTGSYSGIQHYDP